MPLIARTNADVSWPSGIVSPRPPSSGTRLLKAARLPWLTAATVFLIWISLSDLIVNHRDALLCRDRLPHERLERVRLGQWVRDKHCRDRPKGSTAGMSRK